MNEQWDDVIDNPGIESLQAAIVSDNLELITKLHTMMVPTLCLLDQNTSPEAKETHKFTGQIRYNFCVVAKR
jgi:hypothetical protein